MDWMSKKVKDEVETMSKRQEQARKTIPAQYHQFIVHIRQSKQIGQLPKGQSLSQEARQLGAYDKDGKVYVPLETPYLTVDGRVAWARTEHREEGKKLSIDTWYDPDTKLFVAVAESEIYGKGKGHSIVNFGGGGVDRTNPMENAESSAIGRALGFLGYGLLGTGIASAEEVMAAINAGKSLEEQPSQVTQAKALAPANVSIQNTVDPIPDKKPEMSTPPAPVATETPATRQTFSGDVTVKNIRYEESPNNTGMMAILDGVDENGQQISFYTTNSLRDRLDEHPVILNTIVWIVAQQIQGKWVAMDMKQEHLEIA